MQSSATNAQQIRPQAFAATQQFSLHCRNCFLSRMTCRSGEIGGIERGWGFLCSRRTVVVLWLKPVVFAASIGALITEIMSKKIILLSNRFMRFSLVI
jgi:hypothetical protein